MSEISSTWIFDAISGAYPVSSIAIVLWFASYTVATLAFKRHIKELNSIIERLDAQLNRIH